jgi:glyoxylate/hydroxypyruvate reductase A
MTVLVQFSGGHFFNDWAPILRKLDPQLDLREWPDVGNADEIDAAIVWRHHYGTLTQFPNLKVICNLGAGVEHILADEDLPDGVPITRVIDPRMTGAMSEYMILHVLRYHRRLDETQRNQAAKVWEYLPPDNAATTTVGILGLGELGLDSAAKIGALGFRIAGWSRTAKSLPGIETFHGNDGLTAFLNQCKMLICLLPLTAETIGIINADTLAALPDGAYIINAARGGHVVDDDLLAALNSGHIAGATLDVFDEEPLVQDHAYWTHPNVTITPHNAADSFPEDVAPQLVENIRRALAGKDLLNLVERTRGY